MYLAGKVPRVVLVMPREVAVMELALVQAQSMDWVDVASGAPMTPAAFTTFGDNTNVCPFKPAGMPF